MRSIRKLYFQNAAGERLGLNGENGIYATNLSGFGFTLNYSFADLDKGFFPLVTSEKDPQNTLAFTIVITDDAYSHHQSLMDWLAAAEILTIVYDPTGKQEYCRDVVVKFIQKGELNQTKWLSLPSSFACTSPWYLPAPAKLQVSGSAVEGKRYEYSYAEALRYGADSDAFMSAALAARGHIPGAIRIAFRGAIQNPVLKLTGSRTGKVVGICRLPITLTETDQLEYSSLYEDSYVRKISADGTVTDLLDVLDLALTPFFRTPVNEPSTLSVESDAAFSGTAELQIYYYFRSV